MKTVIQYRSQAHSQEEAELLVESLHPLVGCMDAHADCDGQLLHILRWNRGYQPRHFLTGIFTAHRGSPEMRRNLISSLAAACSSIEGRVRTAH
jgi:hypothetical protein